MRPIRIYHLSSALLTVVRPCLAGPIPMASKRIERVACTLQDEWAHAHGGSSPQRARALRSFVRYYNRRNVAAADNPSVA